MGKIYKTYYFTLRKPTLEKNTKFLSQIPEERGPIGDINDDGNVIIIYEAFAPAYARCKKRRAVGLARMRGDKLWENLR